MWVLKDVNFKNQNWISAITVANATSKYSISK